MLMEGFFGSDAFFEQLHCAAGWNTFQNQKIPPATHSTATRLFCYVSALVGRKCGRIPRTQPFVCRHVDSFHDINHSTSVFRPELFTHTIHSAVLPAAHRCAAMPGRKSSTCKSLGSALCENCRSTRKLKCLNSGAAAAAPRTAASRRERRCDEEVAKAPTLAQPEHPASRNQRLSDKRIGGGQHAGAKNVAQSSAHRQQTALLHASRQRADELRKASSQRAAGAAASRRRTRLAPWRCSRSWGVPAATPLLRRRRRTFSLSGASAIMLTSWCYSA